MENINTLGVFERLNRWFQESITVKLLSIGFLVLILLIPSSWISGLIRERQGRAEEVVDEVSAKWSGAQALSGPILVVPYKATQKIDKGKDGVEYRDYTEKYFFLPETLDVKGTLSPQVLHRGIFDVAVYSGDLLVNSDFTQPDFSTLGIAEENVYWKDACMIFSISDLRGIKENPGFTVGGKEVPTEPSADVGVSFKEKIKGQSEYYNNDDGQINYSSNGIVAKLGWKSREDFAGKTSVKLSLKGSQMMSFTPTGKTTTVALSGEWNDPSFDGEFLPDSREFSEKGFSASWKILHYNRPFSQQWTGTGATMGGSEFGVRLLVPVDQYQKSMRTSKYGELVIILTFMSLFLVEILRKIRIHPFQYILVGVALIIYYTLLLSLSEQIGYDLAYWIATAATTALISFYSVSFLREKSMVILFTSLLVVFYTFIYIIILQQDFSLLIGSIGLFLIVGALMYFSRKVEWYKQDLTPGKG